MAVIWLCQQCRDALGIAADATYGKKVRSGCDVDDPEGRRLAVAVETEEVLIAVVRHLRESE